MANRKNGKLNYNGKEISFDMAAQLEETNKKLKETLKLQKAHTQELKEQGKISDELYKKRQAQYNLDSKAQKAMHNGLKLTREQQKDLLTNADKNNKIISQGISTANASRNTGFKGLNAWYADYTQQKYNKVYQEIAERQYNKVSSNGKKSLTQKQYDKLQTDIEKEFTESITKNSKDFGKYTEVFKIATDTFNKAVSTWVGVAKTGLNNQSTAYENTFENISVRNRVTRRQYASAQVKTNNILGSLGLRENIATSEVQNMWNTMATNGLKIDMSSEQARAEVTAKAIDTILTNKIVPYLDMSSSATQQIADSNPNFLKQVRGIGLATTELQGSSTFITKHLQELVTDIAPMASLAQNELGLQFAQISGSYEELRNKYKLNDAQIGALYKNSAAVYENPYAALTNGTLDQQMAVAAGLSDNIDFSDFATVDKYVRNKTNEVVNWVPEGNTATFFGGMLSSLGLTGTDALTNAILNKKNIPMDEVNAAGERTAAETNAAAERATQDYTNDKNQTNTTLQDVTLENLMNELALGKEWLGHWTDILVTAIKGIGTILLTKVIGGGIGKGISMLAGLGGATLPVSGGLGAVLGIGGPIALGIAGVAGTAAIINSKIAQQHNEDRSEHIGNTTGAYQSSIDEGLSEEQARADAWGSYQHSDNGIFQNSGEINASFYTNDKIAGGGYVKSSHSWDDYVNNDNIKFNIDGEGNSILEAFTGQSGELRDEFGFKRKLLQTGSEEARIALNKYREAYDRYNYNRIKVYGLATLLDQNKSIPFNVAMAALSAAVIHGNYTDDNDIMGPLNDSKYGFNNNVLTDKEKLIKTMEYSGITEAKQLSSIYRLLKESSVDFWLMAPGKDKWMGFPSEDELKSEFNLHRYGLNEVPYDDYPAMLHQGEAVLTANTANVLRDLLSEYQETSTQAVNFDTIIQTQTSALIAKMEDIINVISSNSGSNFKPSTEQTKARSILEHSMLHLTSTKNF